MSLGRDYLADQSQSFPIHQTAEGSDHMEPAVVENYRDGGTKEFKTHNPIPENKTFVTTYQGKKVTFTVDMNFYTDPDRVVVKVINVEEK